MKISCEVIQDLLPLYVDGICSEHSKRLVEEHLLECEKCRKAIDDAHSVPDMIIQPEKQEKDTIVTSGLKKVRRRWVLSIIAVLMIVPACLLGVMGYNQISGNGISFTNIDDIIRSHRFVEALASGDGEKAASYLDLSGAYDEIQGLLDSPVENFSPQLVEVVIGNEAWVAETSFADRYLNEANDPVQTWSYLVYNGVYGAMIPETAWKEIITRDPDTYQKNPDGTETVRGNDYIRLETGWGAFMVDVHSLNKLTADDIPRYVYSQQILLLPLNVYQGLSAEIESIATKGKNEIQDSYGHFDDMSADEYTGFRQQEYSAALNNLFQEGFIIFSKGYQSAYSIGNRVIVTFALYVKCPEGDGVVYLDIESTDGKITAIMTHHANQADWIDSFVDAVFIS